MTKEQKAAIEGLSYRAKQVWDRMQDGRFWSGPHDDDLPKCISELIAANLVTTIVRATELRCCYAPVGSEHAVCDKIADYRQVAA